MRKLRIFAIMMASTLFAGCVGARVGCRWGYGEAPPADGLYGGPFVQAPISEPEGLSSNAGVVATAEASMLFASGERTYAFAPGFVLAGENLWGASAPGVGLAIGFEYGEGFTWQASGCAGTFGLVEAYGCARWSSRRYVGVDFNAAATPLGFADPSIWSEGIRF